MLRRLLLAALVAAAFAVGLVLPSVVGAQQTPPPGAPAAPANIVHFGGRVTWTDNSDNEDGFRVRFRFDGPLVDAADVVVEVGPDVEEFVLPSDAPELCDGVHDAFFFSVAAFNGSGESALTVGNIVADCGPVIAAATASDPAVQLPAAGFGAATNSWRSPYLQAIVASIAATIAVAGMLVRASRRR